MSWRFLHALVDVPPLRPEHGPVLEPAPASGVADDFAAGEWAAVYQFVEQWGDFRDRPRGQRYAPCFDELVPNAEKQRKGRASPPRKGDRGVGPRPATEGTNWNDMLMRDPPPTTWRAGLSAAAKGSGIQACCLRNGARTGEKVPKRQFATVLAALVALAAAPIGSAADMAGADIVNTDGEVIGKAAFVPTRKMSPRLRNVILQRPEQS